MPYMGENPEFFGLAGRLVKKKPAGRGERFFVFPVDEQNRARAEILDEIYWFGLLGEIYPRLSLEEPGNLVLEDECEQWMFVSSAEYFSFQIVIVSHGNHCPNAWVKGCATDGSRTTHGETEGANLACIRLLGEKIGCSSYVQRFSISQGVDGFLTVAATAPVK